MAPRPSRQVGPRGITEATHPVHVQITRVARDLFTTSDQITLKVERDPFGTVSSVLLSTSRVRNLRFVKRSGIVGSLGSQ